MFFVVEAAMVDQGYQQMLQSHKGCESLNVVGKQAPQLFCLSELCFFYQNTMTNLSRHENYKTTNVHLVTWITIANFAIFLL